MMAEAIISAVEELGGLRVPLVIRLQGTDAEKGQAMVSLYRLHQQPLYNMH